MNYHLDPLTAITARPGFYRHTNNYSTKNDRIYKKSKYTYAMIESELKVSHSTIKRAKLALYGSMVELDDEKYHKIIEYIKEQKTHPRRKHGVTIIKLADEYGINRNTAISLSLKLLGKRANYTSDEVEQLKNYLSTVKIRRVMRRVKK